jgi:hypothetical protein
MQATCHRCNQPIFTASSSTAEARALCPHCQTLLDFSSEFVAYKTVERAVHQPVGYILKQDNSGLHLGYTWRKGSLGFGIMVVIVINLLVAWWFADAFKHQRVDQTLVGLVFLAVGIASLYGLLLVTFNRTDIYVTPAQLTIHSGPLPVWGNRTLESERIRQIYVREIKHQANHRMHISYRVQAVLRDGEDVVLVNNLIKAFTSSSKSSAISVSVMLIWLMNTAALNRL